MSKPQLMVRVAPEVKARLERLAVALGKRLPGADLGMADAMRAAIDKGLSALEAELGITP